MVIAGNNHIKRKSSNTLKVPLALTWTIAIRPALQLRNWKMNRTIFLEALGY